MASAEFALADEVNLGTYHLRALMDGPAGNNAKNTAEIALNVERYVLPKFKVAIDFAGKGEKASHGYRPGDHVTGTVRANYFFGKPVDKAVVTVKASGMDVQVVDVAAAEGKTDDDGAYRFDLKLPAYFAGKPLSQGAARVLVEATVKDATSHSETRGEPITVSESPLLITAVPEGGTLIPGIENQVFVLTSYADGTPARTELRVQAAGNPDRSPSTPTTAAWPWCGSRRRPARECWRWRPQTTRAIARPLPCRSSFARAPSRSCCAPSAPFTTPATASSSACFRRASRGPCTWTR